MGNGGIGVGSGEGSGGIGSRDDKFGLGFKATTDFGGLGVLNGLDCVLAVVFCLMLGMEASGLESNLDGVLFVRLPLLPPLAIARIAAPDVSDFVIVLNLGVVWFTATGLSFGGVFCFIFTALGVDGSSTRMISIGFSASLGVLNQRLPRVSIAICSTAEPMKLKTRKEVRTFSSFSRCSATLLEKLIKTGSPVF